MSLCAIGAGLAVAAGMREPLLMSTPPFRPLHRLALVTQVLLAGHCAVALLGFVPEHVWDGILSASGGEESLVGALGTLALGAGALVSLLGIVIGTFIAFLMWMNRAAWNVRALNPGAVFTFTPGWCVGWWFIPFANLSKPYYAMKEIAQASLATTEPGHREFPASTWMTVAPPTILSVWWAAWIASNIVERIASKAEANVPLAVISLVFTFAAAIACSLVIRTISEAQEEAAARQAEGPRFAEGIAHVTH